MNLAKVQQIICELRDPENILYRPRFTGETWESDALDPVRMKLLDCLAWIELGGRKYDNRMLGALRHLLRTIKARISVRALQDPENVTHYQEEYRDELTRRLRDICRLIRDIPP